METSDKARLTRRSVVMEALAPGIVIVEQGGDWRPIAQHVLDYGDMMFRKGQEAMRGDIVADLRERGLYYPANIASRQPLQEPSE